MNTVPQPVSSVSSRFESFRFNCLGNIALIISTPLVSYGWSDSLCVGLPLHPSPMEGVPHYV